MDMDGRDAVLLAEVTGVLAHFGALRCSPEIVSEDGYLTLTLAFQPHVDALYSTLELYHALRYLTDMAQLRALADRFHIEPARLEALLPKTGDLS